MIRIQQIKLPINHTKADLEQKIRKILRLKPQQAFTYSIWKQSIDARRKNEICYVYTIDAVVQNMTTAQAKAYIQKINNKNIMLTNKTVYHVTPSGKENLKHRPLIIGSGPAGLFCAYLLATFGYQPIVIERGRQVEKRKQDVDRLWKEGILDPCSNVQFGEGGAGTFSDGKLNTLVKDAAGRNRFVLETFVHCGADSGILSIHNPHMGTDCLMQVVKNMRQEIIRLGGEFWFETCLTDLQIQEGGLQTVTITTKEYDKEVAADLVVLATGHSARDTFAMLSQKQVPMTAKSFAVGLRIEHPQQMINAHQYHGADMRYLPAASYKVTANFPKMRGVYSFCMCPGGYVVNASSEKECLAVNGMSYHKRDGKNANSAVIVAVTPEDFKEPSALGAIAFQRELESRAFMLGNGKIPQQLYGDYVAGRCSAGYGDFMSQTKGARTFADLSDLLPLELKEAFICGIEQFASYIPGFNRYDAILSGVESRTSSPVRILRDHLYQSSVLGIYPCGEGAGYAGGIMSAAMDGLKTAEAILARYRPF